MGPRRWMALASIALAVVVLTYAFGWLYMDPQHAPGRAAGKDTVEQIPSNPDTVKPR